MFERLAYREQLLNVNSNLQVRQRIAETAMDEATHVITLESVLTAGGAKPTEACQYSFPYTDVTSFLGLSSVLEGVGVTAYLGAAALITSPTYLTAAGMLMLLAREIGC